METNGKSWCIRCGDWTLVENDCCRACGKSLMREPSTAEMEAEWAAKGYVQ